MKKAKVSLFFQVLAVAIPFLFFKVSIIVATTYTTPTLDGNITTDWESDENMGAPSGQATWSLWFTWDADYLYLGLIGPDLYPSNNDTVLTYIDARAGGTSTGVNGETLGMTADFAIQLRQNRTNSGYYVYDGGWGSLTVLAAGELEWNSSIDHTELRVSWSTMTNGLTSGPTSFSGLAVNSTKSGSYSAAWPSENTDLASTTFTFAWTESGGEGITPNAAPVVENPSDQSLPVELSTFTAKSEGRAVTLFWRTATEVNNSGFSIYRSEEKNGTYTKIGFVPGAGNSAIPIDYQFTDEEAELGKTYFYYLEDIDIAGEKDKSETIKVVVTPTKKLKVVVPPAKPALPIPTNFALLQNYPNPFNPETFLPYQLHQPAEVVIRIYNAQGQLVRTLDLGHRKAGFYLDRTRAAYWNGLNDSSEPVSSGLYFYQIQAGEFNATRRMVILK
ncbi:MAG: T9SS type A sorting domain-containing protein [Planctomycetota bacterium]